MVTAAKRIEKRSGDAGAGLAKRKAAARAAAGPTVADCRRVATRLKMVSDGTRVGILLALVDGEKHVTTLMGQLEMPQAAMSHHLTLLRAAGVVVPRRQGQHNFYSLSDTGRELLVAVRTMMA
jgi:DNA-binding transcriptional ArsR family regulator